MRAGRERESHSDIWVGRAKNNERLRLKNAAHALISLNGHNGGMSSSMYFQEVEDEAEENAGEDSDGQSPVFSFREDEGKDEMSGRDRVSARGGGGAVSHAAADPEFSDSSLSSIEV